MWLSECCSGERGKDPYGIKQTFECLVLKNVVSICSGLMLPDWDHMLFSSLNMYKPSEPWGHWHPWLPLPASPGASHHPALLQPSCPPPTGWCPALAVDAGCAPCCLQAALVPAGIGQTGWQDPALTLWWAPPRSAPRRSQPLPDTNTSTNVKL